MNDKLEMKIYIFVLQTCKHTNYAYEDVYIKISFKIKIHS